jgi:hypothetical protein
MREEWVCHFGPWSKCIAVLGGNLSLGLNWIGLHGLVRLLQSWELQKSLRIDPWSVVQTDSADKAPREPTDRFAALRRIARDE